jgi:protein O-GlcNAc transferase
MYQDLLFAWPDDLPRLGVSSPMSIDQIAICLRCQDFLSAQNAILSHLGSSPGVEDYASLSALLCYLAYARLDFNSLCAHLSAYAALDSSDPLLLRFFRLQAWILGCQYHSSGVPPDLTHQLGNDWQPIIASKAAILILQGDLYSAEALLQRVAEPRILEVVCQLAALNARSGLFSQAIDLLTDAVQRFPVHLPLQVQYANTLLEARSQDLTLPALRAALTIHGEHPGLMASVCTVKLLQRQPSLARRAMLSQRLWPLAASRDRGRTSNLFVAYEQTGHSDWLAHLSQLPPNLGPSQLPVQENRCLQLASVQSPLLPQQLSLVVQAYKLSPVAEPFNRYSSIDSSFPRALRIGWVSGDVCHHPVSRFLLGFFEASSHSLLHQHVLVNLRDHLSESYLDRFQRYPKLQHVNASVESLASKVDVIRDAQLDVAIDLSGWTGGHFMRGFMARLAPLQVNYLGYFASTGLPTMDAWIGDSGLFPTPMQEWHSEQIHRLSRCFIAWQPSQQLDEAHEPVTDEPTGGIRFGCFNHNRKLSDTVLRLWGDLLNSVPGSSLVLKANASTDPYTQTLLVRRMRRAGLDPDRVIWLPLAGTHREHLQQYRHVDVALDSFPNGGCTTTCEALWMGVPVITLTGTHYVSRMSTAVLQGAGMTDWCANTPQHYVSLAKQQADRLAELRQNRDRWRSQVMHHPLGDAADLMHHLEHALLELHSTALTAQASR